jgi:hypothetical protein
MVPGIGASAHVSPEVEESQNKGQASEIVRTQEERIRPHQVHGFFQDIDSGLAVATFALALHLSSNRRCPIVIS